MQPTSPKAHGRRTKSKPAVPPPSPASTPNPTTPLRSDPVLRTVMKLLPTSDWHVGRTALGKSRTTDFDAVLREIIGIARDSEPDVILHTGDLFDASRPAVADMRQGISALQSLARVAP